MLIVNYLLSLRALDVNCRNIHEETPLMIALREDRQELLEDLLLHGADPNPGTWLVVLHFILL